MNPFSYNIQIPLARDIVSSEGKYEEKEIGISLIQIVPIFRSMVFVKEFNYRIGIVIVRRHLQASIPISGFHHASQP